MIPPHHIYQIYHSLSVMDDCTPPKYGELSEYTDSAHTEVEDPSLGYMNGSNNSRKLKADSGSALDLWPEYVSPVKGRNKTE